MSRIGERIKELSSLGIKLVVDEDQLRVRASRDVMTDEIVAELKSEKQSFLEYLRQSTGQVNSSIPSVTRTDPLPLSYSQQRLWFLDQLQGSSSLYNIPLAARFTGLLDKVALEYALTEIVKRHEVLRTRVVAGNHGEPVQQVCDDELIVSYLSIEANESNEDQALLELCEQECLTPFDLATPLKIRATLVELESRENEFVLLITMHHIASDGWSVDLFVQEFKELYSAQVERRPARVPELVVQYVDYAAWLRQWLSEDRLKEQTDYWCAQLSDSPALIGLPTDHQRPSVQSYEGDTHRFSVSTELTEQLRSLGATQSATLYMTLLSAFNILLSRYSAEKDIVVGSPIANRLRNEIEPMIGFFVNTLVLRTTLDDDISYLQLLGQVRETTLSAYQHQEVPFEKLVEELQPERSTSYSPLFQVMFILQPQPESHLQLPDVAVELLNTSDTTAKFDLTLGLSETDGALDAWVNYSTDLFDRETIERLSRHYVRLLESIVSSPSSRISQLQLLDESERDRLVLELNSTQMSYPQEKTVSQLMSEQVERDGESVAVEGPDARQWSYGQLDSWSNRVARHLQGLGVVRGDRIGVYLERSVEMLGVLLGVMKSGGVYVPLDPMFPADRLKYMAEDARLKVVLSQEALLETVPGEGHELVVLEQVADQLLQLSDESVDESVAESAAYVIYTSGSTGQPKGVQVSHRALVNFLYAMRQSPGLEADDRLLAVTTLSFDIAALELYLPLITGARTVLASREESMDPQRLSSRLASSGATVMQATPASWKMLLDWGWQGDARLRVLCGGEPLSRDLADRLLERSGQLWNLYGPTETTIWSTVSRIERGTGAITVGSPIGNTQVYVLDEQSHVVPLGVSGELYIGGDGVADGYLYREELTAERFVANPFAQSTESGSRLYRTGDQARWTASGELEVLGRLDDQVKLRGYRIEPGEIRSALVGQSGVRDAVVVVREQDSGESQLVAYLVGETDGPELQVSELRAVLKQVMPEYMVPGAWVVLDQLPLTPNGKVDRKQLPAPSGTAAAAVEEYVEPSGELEQRIAQVWSRVLGREPVSVESSFFELGGHSLLAVKLVSELHRTLQIRVSLLELFQGLTVRELADRLDQGDSPGRSDGLEDAGVALSEIEAVERTGPLPLSLTHERFLFLAEMYPEGVAYNIPLLFALRGTLDEQAFASSVHRIVERHEALRTFFPREPDGRLVQVISPEPNHDYELVDVSGASDPLVEARRLSELEANRAFDLHGGPVLRLRLYRCTDQLHVFCWVLHHVVSDGWSSRIFLRELHDLYAQYCGGEEAQLPELRIQYADFGEWERAQLEQGAFDDQLAYWKKRFATPLEALALPTDRVRPAALSYRGSMVEFTLSEKLMSELKSLSRERGVTLFTLLLSAYQILLSRYSGQTDICVGSPIARRTREELENVYGCLISSVALRADLQGDPTLSDLLAQTGRLSAEAFANQDVPFEFVVEAVNPERNTSITPLFQAMFIFHAQSESAIERLGELEVSSLELFASASKFDVTLEFSDSDQSGWASLEYSTDLFDRETIERLSRHYVRLLESIVSSPSSRISQLQLLDESERDRLVLELNSTQMSYPQEKTVSQLMSEQVERDGESVAVEGPDARQWSYGQLDSWSNRVARHLQGLGVVRGDRIGVYLERSVEMLGVLLGVMKSGGVYVPLDPMFPADRLKYMAEDARLKVVLSQEALLETVPGEGHELVVLEQVADQLLQLSDESVDESVAESAAYVIYTSGSTGQPKGVQVSHRALVNFLYAMRQSPGLEADDRLLAVTTLSFDIAALELYLPLITGARTVLASREESMDPQRLSSRLASSGATVMQATPASWKMLLDWGWQGDARLRVLCGGEPLSRDLADRLLERSGQLWNLYGPTETTIWSTVSRIERGTGAITVGSPIGNTQVYVLDEQSHVVPLGVSGELYIGGDGVADGYLYREELTAERFVANPFAQSTESGSRLYRTGDQARWTASGELEVLGRLDDQVKLRGYRIEPGEIRSALVGQSGVRDAVVVVREQDSGESQLVAYLVGETDGPELQVSELRAVLKQVMPEYMVPGAWVVLDQLPLTPNGKVDRKQLPAPSGTAAAAVEEYVEPSGELEQRIAQVWSRVLGREPVSVESSFFELGGHSLLAVKLVSELHRTLQIRVSLLELFQGLTVRELADRLDQGDSPGRSDGLEDAGVALSEIEAVERTGPLPLSLTHERFLFLAEMYPEGVAYNIPLLFALRGTLDEQAFASSVHRIVERHEALRTFFPREPDGRLVQVISPEPNHDYELVDVSGASDPLVEARRLSELEANRAFDLHGGPVLRLRLYRCTDQLHVFCWVLHHVVSDGWSSRIFLRELHDLYAQYCGGEEAQLPELRIQYADFGEWERAQLEQGAFDDQLAYWKKRFATPLEALALPTDRVRPAALSYRGSMVEFTLSEKLMSELKSLSRERGVTLFTLLLSAYQILLSRYSGQTDICVGSPIARRTREELENVYGCLISSVALRADLQGDPTLSDLLAQTGRLSAEAFANQDVPFEFVVEAVNPERNTSITPLFQAMFIFHAQSESAIERLGELEVSSLELFASASKFDVTLEFSDSDQSGWASLEYSTDLFDRETIERLSRHYVRLLESIVSSPSSRISQLQLLDESERDRLVLELNSTQMSYPQEKTVSQLMSEQVERDGESVAVEGPDARQWSYGQLDSWSNRVARHLQGLGVVRGDRIGVYLERSVEMLGVLLGVMKSGGVYVPLDPMFPADRLKYMAEDARLKVVLSQEALLETVPGEGHELVVLEQVADQLLQLSDESVDESVAESAAYVIYTSGSTGQPKGVQVSHRALVNFLYAMRQSPGLEADDRLLAVTTLSFDIAALELYLPLITGARTVLASREESMDPQRLSSRLASSGATVMQATPASWKMLLDWGWQGDARLRVLCGGEPLSRDLADRLLERSGQLWNLYGPTETTIWSTVSRIERGTGAITVGSPIGNTQVYVLDEQSHVVPLGVSGELYIGGDGVADGYLYREELTAERFVANPFAQSTESGSRLYRTGDQARWTASGELEVLGRLDDQVKLRGYRIEPGEIRSALVGQSGVRDAVVVVREQDSGESQLVAYLVGETDGPELQVSELRAVLKQVMPEYMVPGAWVVLDQLPLTPNGKVDRKQLPAPSGTAAAAVEEYVEPSGELEQRIAQVWSRVLGREPVSVESSFFELGGHSLLAVKLVSELHRTLQIRVSLLELFQGLTVRELADRLDQGDSPGRSDVPKSCRLITKPGNLTPLFMVGSNPRYMVASGRLNDDQPVYQLDAYALQLRRGAIRKHAYNTIERIAAAFVEDIKKVQPEGPYMVGGGCEGALVAFEIALQLQTQGDRVIKLITWHTPPPGPALKEQFGGSTLRRMWWQLQTILSKGSINNVGIRGYLDLIQHEYIEYTIFSAMFKYRPKAVFDGDMDAVVLDPVIPQDFDDIEQLYANELEGWRRLVTQEISVQKLLGNHDTWLRDHAEVFGDYLESRLDQIRKIN